MLWLGWLFDFILVLNDLLPGLIWVGVSMCWVSLLVRWLGFCLQLGWIFV